MCETCRWSTIIRGRKLGEEIVECSSLSYANRRIPFAVTSCTGYSDRRAAGLQEMQELAWILRSDALRHQVGFVRSSKLPDDERFVLEED